MQNINIFVRYCLPNFLTHHHDVRQKYYVIGTIRTKVLQTTIGSFSRMVILSKDCSQEAIYISSPTKNTKKQQKPRYYVTGKILTAGLFRKQLFMLLSYWYHTFNSFCMKILRLNHFLGKYIFEYSSCWVLLRLPYFVIKEKIYVA